MPYRLVTFPTLWDQLTALSQLANAWLSGALSWGFTEVVRDLHSDRKPWGN
jgi:hypothetical protein